MRAVGTNRLGGTAGQMHTGLACVRDSRGLLLLGTASPCLSVVCSTCASTAAQAGVGQSQIVAKVIARRQFRQFQQVLLKSPNMSFCGDSTPPGIETTGRYEAGRARKPKLWHTGPRALHPFVKIPELPCQARPNNSEQKHLFLDSRGLDHPGIQAS